MPRHNTERAQAIRERNDEIVEMRLSGFPELVVATKLGITTRVVECVMRRHREAPEHHTLPLGGTSTERWLRASAMAAEGLVHANGWIKGTDEPAFARLVAKAAPIVDGITGEE